jgi:queuine tRNA-ribosyltransferase
MMDPEASPAALPAAPDNNIWRFEVHGPADGPRVGALQTPHGMIRTPAFMPVGTRATVKAMLPEEVRATGADILLSNTFHLHLRPGEAIIQKAGGLHRFMNWSGPILTDSGGFQVYSLSDLRRIGEEGVRFRSPIDGRQIELSPEKAIEIQYRLGADIIMAFDECPPPDYDEAQAARSMEMTLRWLDRCFAAKARLEADGPGGSGTPQALFPICQGGLFSKLRENSARATAQRDAVGYAIGGLSVGESKKEMFEGLEASISGLPADKPRYLMGVGTPADFVAAIERGVDMFDCVLPTRNARNGQALAWEGRFIAKHARHAEDFGPLSASCGCPTCRNYSRAYLRHLYQSGEILSARLLTMHNLWFFQDFMKQAREAIVAFQWQEFKARAAAAMTVAGGEGSPERAGGNS